MSHPELQRLVRDPTVEIGQIAALLDGLDFARKDAAARGLGRADQRRLWNKASAAPPLTVDDFVPPSVGPRVEVIHHGRNTLPLPPPHSRFQKRFCRPEGAQGRLFGYNESPSRGLIGPGYFVLIPTAGEPLWPERGSVVVDYFQVPDGPVVAGWPEVVPNSHGLQKLVYFQTRDFMRRVADGVTIGAAYKRENPLDHYFVLVRDPVG